MSLRKDSDDDPDLDVDDELEDFEPEDDDVEEDYGYPIFRNAGLNSEQIDRIEDQYDENSTVQNKYYIPPPLPLLKFEDEKDVDAGVVRTVTGIQLPKIENTFGKPLSSYTPYPTKENPLGTDPLHDPTISRLLSKWFKARGNKEATIRQLDTDDQIIKAGITNNIIGDNEELVNLIDDVVYDVAKFGEINNHSPKLESSETDSTIAAQVVAASGADLSRCVTESESNVSSNLSALMSVVPPLDASNIEKPVGPSPGGQKQVPNFNLIFDAHFECGNLSRAVRVFNREKLMNVKSLEYLKEYVIPEEVHQEYDLWARKDLFTEGNIQWFYFSASCAHLKMSSKGLSTILGKSENESENENQKGNNVGSADSLNDAGCIQYPLRVRFNIVNMQKNDALYNYGMRPAVYSSLLQSAAGWKHLGEDICYYKNGNTFVKQDTTNSTSGKKKRMMNLKKLYTLSFTYTFNGPDTVYFAHCFPYTYSDLQRYLDSLESDTRLSGILYRKLLCRSLAGNRCDILTITERNGDIAEIMNRPAIAISGRVHPGESNSSFIMHGIIEFLTSTAPEADLLRRNFVFKIVPMLNPDGVIHGNYRASLSGADLNRRYQNTNASFYPTIAAFKSMLKSLHTERKIFLYLDLHGHSKKKNTFLYGCDVYQQPAYLGQRSSTIMTPDDIINRRIHSRVFPKVLSMVHSYRNGGYFNFADCNFCIAKSKFSTGRVVGWSELRIEGAYTIESSFCSIGNNNEPMLLKRFEQNVSLLDAANMLSSRIRIRGNSASSNVAGSNNSKTGDNNNINLAVNGDTSGDVNSMASEGVASSTHEAGSGTPGSTNTNTVSTTTSRPSSSVKKSSKSSNNSIVGSAGIAFRPSRRVLAESSKQASSTSTANRASPTNVPNNNDQNLPLAGSQSSPLLNVNGPISVTRNQSPPLPLPEAVTPTTSTKKLPPYLHNVRDLLKSYSSIMHYCKEDYKNMGRIVCLSILYYANIANPNKELEYVISECAENSFGPGASMAPVASILSQQVGSSFSSQSTVSVKDDHPAYVSNTLPPVLNCERRGSTVGADSATTTSSKSSRDSSGTNAVSSRKGSLIGLPSSSSRDDKAGVTDIRQYSSRKQSLQSFAVAETPQIVEPSHTAAAGNDSDATENEFHSECEATDKNLNEAAYAGLTEPSTPKKPSFLMPTLPIINREGIFDPVTISSVYCADAIEYGQRIFPILDALVSQGAGKGIGMRFRCEVELRKYISDLMMITNGVGESNPLSLAIAKPDCDNATAVTSDKYGDEDGDGEDNAEGDSGAGSDSDPSVDNVPLPTSMQSGHIKDASQLLNVLMHAVDRREKQAAKALKVANDKKRKKKRKKQARTSIFDSAAANSSAKSVLAETSKSKPSSSKSVRATARQTTVFSGTSSSRRNSDVSSAVDINAYALDPNDFHEDENQSPLQLYYRTLLASTKVSPPITAAVSPSLMQSMTTSHKEKETKSASASACASMEEVSQRLVPVVALSFGGKPDPASSRITTTQTAASTSIDYTSSLDSSIAISASFEKIAAITANRKSHNNSPSTITRSSSSAASSTTILPSSNLYSSIPGNFTLPSIGSEFRDIAKNEVVGNKLDSSGGSRPSALIRERSQSGPSLSRNVEDIQRESISSTAIPGIGAESNSGSNARDRPHGRRRTSLDALPQADRQPRQSGVSARNTDGRNINGITLAKK